MINGTASDGSYSTPVISHPWPSASSHPLSSECSFNEPESEFLLPCFLNDYPDFPGLYPAQGPILYISRKSGVEGMGDEIIPAIFSRAKAGWIHWQCPTCHLSSHQQCYMMMACHCEGTSGLRNSYWPPGGEFCHGWGWLSMTRFYLPLDLSFALDRILSVFVPLLMVPLGFWYKFHRGNQEMMGLYFLDGFKTQPTTTNHSNPLQPRTCHIHCNSSF